MFPFEFVLRQIVCDVRKCDPRRNVNANVRRIRAGVRTAEFDESIKVSLILWSLVNGWIKDYANKLVARFFNDAYEDRSTGVGSRSRFDDVAPRNTVGVERQVEKLEVVVASARFGPQNLDVNFAIRFGAEFDFYVVIGFHVSANGRFLRHRP